MYARPMLVFRRSPSRTSSAIVNPGFAQDGDVAHLSRTPVYRDGFGQSDPDAARRPSRRAAPAMRFSSSKSV